MAAIRPLSTELQKIATSELNEKEERILDDIQHIRDWLKKQPHLYAEWDDQWIVTFLRGCKYSLQKTKNKLDMFCSVRTFSPDLFQNRYPFTGAIANLQKLNSFVELPQNSNPPKPTLCLLRFNDCDDGTCTFVDVLKYCAMAIDVAIDDNDNLAVHGSEIIIDFAEYGLNFAFQTTPVLLKKMITILEKAYPFRIKGIYAINAPSVVEKLFQIGRQFMSKKMKERLYVYSTSSINELYKHVPREALPKEYGGKNPPIQILADEMNKKIRDYGKRFLDDEKYMSNESLRPASVKSPKDLFDLEGSFRKLEVD